jgi:hypothetical protein
VVAVRWQQLFGDLEAQFAAAEEAADRAEDASRTRAELGRVHLADRLRGALGAELSLRCRGAGDVVGRLADLGPDWLLLRDAWGREVLVAMPVVRSVAGLGVRTVVEDGGPVRVHLDLRRALRGLARDRAAVRLVLDDGGELVGTLDRVGADFLELAEHPADVPRRVADVRRVSAVPLDAVAAVRSLVPEVA